jgi:DNA-binding NarL/FixJ family response regulator
MPTIVIVTLAGLGLTNAEIANRLFLSPRTVASHLYRSYPKLGISGRQQFRYSSTTPNRRPAVMCELRG